MPFDHRGEGAGWQLSYIYSIGKIILGRGRRLIAMHSRSRMAIDHLERGGMDALPYRMWPMSSYMVQNTIHGRGSSSSLANGSRREAQDT